MYGSTEESSLLETQTLICLESLLVPSAPGHQNTKGSPADPAFKWFQVHCGLEEQSGQDGKVLCRGYPRLQDSGREQLTLCSSLEDVQAEEHRADCMLPFPEGMSVHRC